MELDFSRNIARVELMNADVLGSVSFLNGGQLNWTWAVGMPFRVLADPDGIGVMPKSPALVGPGDKGGWSEVAFTHGLGYFASLQSFLTYSFGWTRHDLGLLWWYDNGCPVNDPRFALLKAVWDADGMLLRYLAWCVEQVAVSSSPGWHAGPLLPWAAEMNDAPGLLSDEWRRRLAREEHAARAQALHTSPWGMHLEHGDHIGAPSGWDWAGHGASGAPRELADAARLVGVDSSTRRGIFVSDYVGGWYAALADLGSKLPQLPKGRNWRINVFVKPIGYLGEYRRSRTTGLWFAGQHRFHTVGN